jgi:hypothetical protein
MKTILLIALFWISSISLHSQYQNLSFGVSGGITSSEIKYDNYLDGDYNYSLGFGAELSCTYYLNLHVLFTTNLGILQRGVSYFHESPVTVIDGELENSYFGLESKSKYNYLNNDWLIGYQIGNKTSLSICCGFFYSYYFNTKRYDRSYAYFHPDEIDRISDPSVPVGYSEFENHTIERYETISDWDFGVIGCVYLGYAVNNAILLHVTGKYYYGIQDIGEFKLTEEVNMYNRSIVAFIGIKFRI